MTKRGIAKKVLLENFREKGIMLSDIKPEDDLHELGFDSLDTMEAIMELESVFTVRIKNSEIAKVRTAQDVYNLFVKE
jgi:acyl carrier protein